MRQRRRHLRFRVHQHVWCSDDTRTFYVRVGDASLGGLFVRAPGIEVGRRLRVCFESPDGERVDVATEAVWSGHEARGRLGVGLKILGFGAGADTYERFVRAAATV